jgi:hypothetical protein
LTFVAELNLPAAESDPHGQRWAEWLHSGMVVSVELSYGTPVVILCDNRRRTVLPLTDVELETLRDESRGFSH